MPLCTPRWVHHLCCLQCIRSCWPPHICSKHMPPASSRFCIHIPCINAQKRGLGGSWKCADHGMVVICCMPVLQLSVSTKAVEMVELWRMPHCPNPTGTIAPLHPSTHACFFKFGKPKFAAHLLARDQLHFCPRLLAGIGTSPPFGHTDSPAVYLWLHEWLSQAPKMALKSGMSRL